MVASLAGSALLLAPALHAAALDASPPPESGIVDIDTNLGYEQASAAGTGMVLMPSGEVLTNNHVIRGSTSIHVVVPGTGARYRATVVGYDVGADVAVLQVEGVSNMATVTTGDSSALSVGTPVTAVGNAGGVGGTPTVTTGTVLALAQTVAVRDDDGGVEHLSGLLETSAALQPGDSGGPLLTSAGAVVGMDTAGATGFDLQPADATAYAIPIATALAIAAQIEAGTSSLAVHIGATPFIGIEVEPPDRDSGATGGALVVGVVPSSPAQRLGLADGDLITAFAGSKITSFTAITGVIVKLAPGATVGIGWVNQASGVSHRGRVRLVSGPPQ